MGTNKKPRLIEISFAVVSVIAVWQLNLPTAFDYFAKFLGAAQDSILHRVIVDGGVPLVIVVIAWSSLKLYQTALWPFWPKSNCQRGWWIYSLIAKTTQGDLEVVGYFHVNHNSDEALVSEGHSFYVEEQGLRYRGTWQSDSVLVTINRVRLLFNMRTINPTKELPSQYDGFIEMKLISDKPKCGRTCWFGYFHDLGDRRNIAGPIYAERLGYRGRKPGNKMKMLLHNNAAILITNARERAS